MRVANCRRTTILASPRSLTRRGRARPRPRTARARGRGPGGGSSCAPKRGFDFVSPLLPFSLSFFSVPLSHCCFCERCPLPSSLVLPPLRICPACNLLAFPFSFFLISPRLGEIVSPSPLRLPKTTFEWNSKPNPSCTRFSLALLPSRSVNLPNALSFPLLSFPFPSACRVTTTQHTVCDRCRFLPYLCSRRPGRRNQKSWNDYIVSRFGFVQRSCKQRICKAGAIVLLPLFILRCQQA